MKPKEVSTGENILTIHLSDEDLSTLWTLCTYDGPFWDMFALRRSRENVSDGGDDPSSHVMNQCAHALATLRIMEWTPREI